MFLNFLFVFAEELLFLFDYVRGIWPIREEDGFIRFSLLLNETLFVASETCDVH